MKTSVPSVSVWLQSTLFSTALVLGMQRGIEAWRLVGETGFVNSKSEGKLSALLGIATPVQKSRVISSVKMAGVVRLFVSLSLKL